MGSRAASRGTVLLLVAVALLAERVSAHAVGGSRFEAPIPLSFLFAGAGLTVAATAGVLAVTDVGGERLERPTLARLSAPVTGTLRVALGVAFLALVGRAVVDGLAGRQVPAENLATVVVWGVWLKGLAILAVLVGNPWPVLSPWRTVHEGLSRLEGEDLALAGTYPDRLGTWPAVVGFLLGAGVLENLTGVPRSPRLTALAVLGYATVMVLGGAAFGREWFRRADLFAVLYRQFGRVAPFDWSRDEAGGVEVSLARPWRPGQPFADLGGAAFVVAAVYTVSFDGFTSTRAFQRVVFGGRGALGVGSEAAPLVYVAGLLLFAGGFALVAWATAGLAGRDPRSTALAVAPTLLPIAAAYELAHTYPFVAQQAAATVGILLGLPVGDPLGWLPLPAFWGSQVALVVLGHVVAVVAAHVALRRWGDVRRTHLPLTVLMVGYTVVSLWIISRPVVS